MKFTRLLTLLLLAGCTPVTTAPIATGQAPRTAPAAVQESEFPALRAFADRMVTSGAVPSISIAVGVGDEAPVFISAGHLTRDPASSATGPDTLWRIYSMTKPVTGIAAMILVDEGKLRLDQPVGDFIPSFRESRVLIDPASSLETRPATRPVTIRDLMTHSSGLNYGIVARGPAAEALKKDGLLPFMFNRAGEEEMRALRPRTLREFAERAGRSGLIADPGTKFSYSMGLDVLAAVIERASGMPYESFLEQRLFKPLNMNSTFWQVPPAQAHRFATFYLPKVVAAFIAPGSGAGDGGNGGGDGKYIMVDSGADSIYFDKPSFPYGGAGLVSTARDYDRFLHMLAGDGKLGNVRILSEKTARLAKSNLLPANVSLVDFGPIPRGEVTGMGAGGFVTMTDFDGFGRHRGTFGWDGAAGTRAWTDPVSGVRAVMMINGASVPNVGEEFDKAVIADLAARKKRR